MVQGFLEIFKIVLKLLGVFLFIFFHFWQSIQFSQLSGEISLKKKEKKELIKKNNELKIGIASYTSVGNIESLYRQTYSYVPITLSERIITLTLPEEKNDNRN